MPGCLDSASTGKGKGVEAADGSPRAGGDDEREGSESSGGGGGGKQERLSSELTSYLRR